MNKKWIKATLLFLLLMVLFSLMGCGLLTQTKSNQGEELIKSDRPVIRVLTDVERQALEEIKQLKTQKDHILEIEREEASFRALIADRLNRTYYINSPETPVFSDPEKMTETGYLKRKTAVLIKTILENSNQVTMGALESETGDSIVGYVEMSLLVKEPSTFIDKPYESVVYTGIPKSPEFTDNPRVLVKGIYVSQPTLGSSKLDELIQMANDTEINAFVIDVVDDYGNTLFYSETANRICPDANGKSGIQDLKPIIQKLKDNNIYLIARIVTFRAPRYAMRYPERAIVYRQTGAHYIQGDGLEWGSAFDETLWTYAAGIAKEAASMGFNEIQFDYVRFPATGSKLDQQLDFHNENNHSKVLAIQQFLLYAKKELENSQVYLTADVFGWSAIDSSDSQIGQHWEAISNAVDYVAPMVYPSHYGPNNFGLPVPDAEPYEAIFRSGQLAQDRNANLRTPALIRPWIQDFTATWVEGHIRYGAEELRAQIDALKDLGIEEFMVWNPRSNYHIKGLKKEENQ